MVDGVIGPYRLLSRVASGAQATVYRATDMRNKRLVALKVLDPRLASDSSHRKRLDREARLAASLDHPNIVKILDIGEEGGTPYIAMEYLWRSLDEVIERESGLPGERVAQIGADISSGLDAAHRAGIIHRDVKPHNVLMTTDGVAQLTDFGIAHARDLTALTRTGARLGTPHYMSPEQVDGGSADERSDIYALGCVMYHMLTGAPPFKGESAMAVMRMHLDATPAPLSARADGVDSRLARIIERCMAKNPADRYMTAAELHQALTGKDVDDAFWPGARRYEIGDEDDTAEEPLTAREMARLLRPDDDLSSDKVCRNCGLGAQANRLYCLRCGFSEWRAWGQSVLTPPLTFTGAERLGRKDKLPEQAIFTKVALLSLLAIVLSLGMTALLIWSERGDSASAGFGDLEVASADLDLPVVKRLRTEPGNGETRVELDPVEAHLLGLDVISFRARFGGIETAIEIEPIPGSAADPPPEPSYRQFKIDVFANPDIGAERFIFRFQVPLTWLAEHEIEPPDVRLWTKSTEWAPLETFNIAVEDGVLTFLGFSPRPGEFAIGALP